jgi:hypothetical protein
VIRRPAPEVIVIVLGPLSHMFLMPEQIRHDENFGI